MHVPFPHEPRCLRGSSRAEARLYVLSVTPRADAGDTAFQLAIDSRGDRNMYLEVAPGPITFVAEPSGWAASFSIAGN